MTAINYSYVYPLNFFKEGTFMLNNLLVLIFCSFLVSCGGSSKDSAPTQSIQTPTQSIIAPTDISNMTFEMTIDNLPTDGLGEHFPAVESNMIQNIQKNNYLYLHSDQYSSW